MRLPLMLNIQTGRKLANKTKDEIMSEVVKILKHVRAVQICDDTIRVTFLKEEIFQRAKAILGVYIFGMWCSIRGGSPLVTVVNLFDYPFEGKISKLRMFCVALGKLNVLDISGTVLVPRSLLVPPLFQLFSRLVVLFSATFPSISLSYVVSWPAFDL